MVIKQNIVAFEAKFVLLHIKKTIIGLSMNEHFITKISGKIFKKKRCICFLFEFSKNYNYTFTEIFICSFLHKEQTVRKFHFRYQRSNILIIELPSHDEK